eukprot:jgi/Chrpa1/16105/Chrysochromulina_OHIO_Genome00007371-RA
MGDFTSSHSFARPKAQRGKFLPGGRSLVAHQNTAPATGKSAPFAWASPAKPQPPRAPVEVLPPQPAFDDMEDDEEVIVEDPTPSAPEPTEISSSTTQISSSTTEISSSTTQISSSTEATTAVQSALALPSTAQPVPLARQHTAGQPTAARLAAGKSAAGRAAAERASSSTVGGSWWGAAPEEIAAFTEALRASERARLPTPAPATALGAPALPVRSRAADAFAASLSFAPPSPELTNPTNPVRCVERVAPELTNPTNPARCVERAAPCLAFVEVAASSAPTSAPSTAPTVPAAAARALPSTAPTSLPSTAPTVPAAARALLLRLVEPSAAAVLAACDGDEPSVAVVRTTLLGQQWPSAWVHAVSSPLCEALLSGATLGEALMTMAIGCGDGEALTTMAAADDADDAGDAGAGAGMMVSRLSTKALIAGLLSPQMPAGLPAPALPTPAVVHEAEAWVVESPVQLKPRKPKTARVPREAPTTARTTPLAPQEAPTTARRSDERAALKLAEIQAAVRSSQSRESQARVPLAVANRAVPILGGAQHGAQHGAHHGARTPAKAVPPPAGAKTPSKGTATVPNTAPSAVPNMAPMTPAKTPAKTPATTPARGALVPPALDLPGSPSSSPPRAPPVVAVTPGGRAWVFDGAQDGADQGVAASTAPLSAHKTPAKTPGTRGVVWVA